MQVDTQTQATIAVANLCLACRPVRFVCRSRRAGGVPESRGGGSGQKEHVLGCQSLCFGLSVALFWSAEAAMQMKSQTAATVALANLG